MNTFSDLIPRANNNNKFALFPKLIVNCHLLASDGLSLYFCALTVMKGETKIIMVRASMKTMMQMMQMRATVIMRLVIAISMETVTIMRLLSSGVLPLRARHF